MGSKVISCLYPVAEGGAGLAAALDEVRAQASAAIADGARIIICVRPQFRREDGPDTVAARRGRGAPPPGAGSQPAPTSVWWWNPVTPARCTTWRC